MLKSFINKLEDTERPLLGPNVKLLKFCGLLLPKNGFKRYLYIPVNAFVVFFIFTQWAEIWFIKSDMKLVLYNLKITTVASITLVKVTSFWIWQKNWRSIIEYVTKEDLLQRTTCDDEKKKIITNYTKYCRVLTYVYWSLMYSAIVIAMAVSVCTFFFVPNYRENVKNGTEQYVEVISSWVPFSKQNIVGYLAASAYQIFSGFYGGSWVSSFDTTAIVIMVFFRREIQMLRQDSANIFGSEKNPVNKTVSRDRLKECHRRHVELIKNAQEFDSLLSPIMFIYFSVCSIMLCVTVYQITAEPSPIQQILSAEYLMFGIAQLFVYCWHSNDILYECQDLYLGPYESIWWMIDTKRRKDVYILMAQFNQILVFSAGPFFDLTVPTFINIVKTAYSCYTLLRQSQMK